MENVDWAALPFNYHKTDYNVRISYKDGKWGEPELTQDEYISVHMSAPCLHYGVESFEGLKAFRGADGKVRLFRPDENGKRFAATARKLCMAELPVETFVEMCRMVVKANERFVPPYGTGATLYLRPLEIGMGAFLGVHPAKEFMVCVFVSPVGAYFKEGIKPIRVIVNPDYDRAAPRGTGDVKCGGNYAASLEAGEEANREGYANSMFVDAVHRKYIEECGAANFFGIKDILTLRRNRPRSCLRSPTRACAVGEGYGDEGRRASRCGRRALDVRGVCRLRNGCGDLAYRLYLRQGNGSRMEFG